MCCNDKGILLGSSSYNTAYHHKFNLKLFSIKTAEQSGEILKLRSDTQSPRVIVQRICGW